MISELEWEAKKKKHNFCCVICNIPEEKCGGLEKAHLEAKSKNGSQIIPMCSNCHKRYDNGMLNDSELSRIGISPDKYHLYLPKGRQPKPNRNKSQTAFDEYQRVQNDVADRFYRR